MAKSFSVSTLTVSKRLGWEEMANKSISRQTVTPKQWVVVTEDAYSHSSLQFYEGADGLAHPITHVPAPPRTKLSNLNASLNKGLRLIDADYVIFLQDNIELERDCFEKLLELATPKTWVTTCTPNYDGSDDGRFTGGKQPRPCRPEEWEANVAIAPMAMIKELGGVDEAYDWGWAYDNCNLAERAAMLGAKFILDESNRPKLYPHEMSSHQTLPLNAQRHSDTMKAIRNGTRPIKNKYL